MRIDDSINSPGYVRSRLCREYLVVDKPLCAIINRGNGRAEVFHKSEHYVFDTKVVLFGAGLRENREEALGFPP
jgi:hypothetical protein